MPTKVRMVCFRGSGRPHLPLRGSPGLKSAPRALPALPEQAALSARQGAAPGACTLRMRTGGRRGSGARRGGRAHQKTPTVIRRRRDRRSAPQNVSSWLTPAWYTGTRSGRTPPACQPRAHHMHRTHPQSRKNTTRHAGRRDEVGGAHQLPPGWPCGQSPCACLGRCSPCWGRRSGRCLPPGLAHETGRCVHTRPHSERTSLAHNRCLPRGPALDQAASSRAGH